MSTKHIAGIDLIRLIAAVLVMLFHYGFWAGAYPYSEATQASHGLIAFPELHAWTNFGWIGVQVFFVISGFVIAFSAERATTYGFFVTRVVRLVPAAFICATISLAVLSWVGFASHRELIAAYLRAILFVPAGAYIDGSYWTLGIEVSFYTLVFALLAIGRFNWIRGLAIVIGLVSTAFWLFYTAVSLQPQSALFQRLLYWQNARIFDLALLHHGCFFALGVLLWAQLVKQANPTNVLWCLLFILAGCLQIHSVELSFRYRYDVEVSGIVACLLWLGSLAAIVLSVKHNDSLHRGPSWWTRSLRSMGLMTYPLYLIHQMVGIVFITVMIAMGVSSYVALFTIIACMLLASWTISTYLEPPLQAATRNVLLKTRNYFALVAARSG